MSSSESFSTTAKKSGSNIKDFLESNSLVSKFAFLLVVVICFVILLRLGISIMSRLLKPNESPLLINGTVDATQALTFVQDPSSSGAVTIYRSQNATDGVEFTWSVWIYINNLQTNARIYKHIFSKGNSYMQENGLIYPNNAPGLYIAPDTNALVLLMNTFNVINEEIIIPDIPIGNWINVIIRCQNTTLDVYINGIINRSINLTGVPKQNYGDVYVAMNGGFDGYISNLKYYNYALGTAEIQRIAANGPNTSMTGSNTYNSSDNTFNYLSLRWFFNDSNNLYNP